MDILIFKTIHIISFTAWFAGLFYLARILVYHSEAFDRPESEAMLFKAQYSLMAKRVYKFVCNPAMLITWIAGLAMLYLYGTEWLKDNPWMHIKLLLVLLLTGYHHYCYGIAKKLDKGKIKFNSFQMRLLNEGSVIFLIVIVILAVFRELATVLYALGVVLVIIILLILIAKIYRSTRIKTK